MLKLFRPLRPYQAEIASANAVNALAIAQTSDPMKNHSLVLGRELELEQLRRKHEDICLALAFSGCVNLAVIIWFLVQATKAVVSF